MGLGWRRLGRNRIFPWGARALVVIGFAYEGMCLVYMYVCAWGAHGERLEVLLGLGKRGGDVSEEHNIKGAGRCERRARQISPWDVGPDGFFWPDPVARFFMVRFGIMQLLVVGLRT